MFKDDFSEIVLVEEKRSHLKMEETSDAKALSVHSSCLGFIQHCQTRQYVDSTTILTFSTIQTFNTRPAVSQLATYLQVSCLLTDIDHSALCPDLEEFYPPPSDIHTIGASNTICPIQGRFKRPITPTNLYLLTKRGFAYMDGALT